MRRIFITLAALLGLTAGLTIRDLMRVPVSLLALTALDPAKQLRDRNGDVLTIHKDQRWNTQNYVPLDDIPLLRTRCLNCSRRQTL